MSMIDRFLWIRQYRTLAVIWTVLMTVFGGGSTFWWLGKLPSEAVNSQNWFVGIIALVSVSICTLCNLLIRWLRWHFVLRRLDLSIPAKRSAHLFGLMLPAALTPFLLGELFLAAFLKPYTRRPILAAAATWVICRSADVFVLSLLLQWTNLILLSAVLCLGTLLFSNRVTQPSEHSPLVLSGETVLRVAAFGAVSFAAWCMAFLSLYIAGVIFQSGPALASSAAIFAKGTLFGSGLGMPGGIFLTGKVMIDELMDSGIDLITAVELVAVIRLGTTGIAALAGGLLWVANWRSARRALSEHDAQGQTHFDCLSDEYADQIPEHVRTHLIHRKVDGMCQALADRSIASGARGLDLGCGHGWYALEMLRRGFEMTGCDPSIGQVDKACELAANNHVKIDFRQAGGEALPFPDASFDFVYSINVIHHINSERAQYQVLNEIIRVLKPGGVFIMHEINIRNPIFRLYMSYLFPLLKRIDDGTELWVRPQSLPAVQGASWCEKIWYFTFLPDFIPDRIVRPMALVQTWLENSALHVWSAHYMAQLVKE
jgi:ubiquinone/menaquinone biosynthesis C-methylase UbiE